jgi:hypothetical protein
MTERPNELEGALTSTTSRAREYYEKTFLPKYRELQWSVEATPLTVLIWGPGHSGRDLYQKRVQIRNLLREKGYAAVFSEDVDAECSFPASAKARELLQALAADFIVVIQASPGSTAEIHDFAGFIQDLGPKMLIFVDSRYVDGYSYTGALNDLKVIYNNVHTYQYPRDIEECLLRAAIEERLRVLRWAKWRQQLK